MSAILDYSKIRMHLDRPIRIIADPTGEVPCRAELKRIVGVLNYWGRFIRERWSPQNIDADIERFCCGRWLWDKFRTRRQHPVEHSNPDALIDVSTMAIYLWRNWFTFGWKINPHEDNSSFKPKRITDEITWADEAMLQGGVSCEACKGVGKIPSKSKSKRKSWIQCRKCWNGYTGVKSIPVPGMVSGAFLNSRFMPRFNGSLQPALWFECMLCCSACEGLGYVSDDNDPHGSFDPEPCDSCGEVGRVPLISKENIYIPSVVLST